MKEELRVGAYPWTVQQVFDKNKFRELKDMSLWVNEENKKFLDSFLPLIGKAVIVTVGNSDKFGNRKVRKYRGIFRKITGTNDYGFGLHLQQVKRTNYINGWQIVDVNEYQ
ncbi:hypothetical protein ACFYU8_18225 [Brevibacillus sp. NPDC003359]|uniref:hypothetical protein n=1 Tax=unclassified Brevibacillus TaxID=2684853 RepID=UPI003693E2B2